MKGYGIIQWVSLEGSWKYSPKAPIMDHAKGFLLIHKSGKLHLCPHAAPSFHMSFWIVPTVLIPLFLSGMPQNFEKEGEK